MSIPDYESFDEPDEPWESMYDWYGLNLWTCWSCGEDRTDVPKPSDFEDFEDYHKFATSYDPSQDPSMEFDTDISSHGSIMRRFVCNCCDNSDPVIEAMWDLCDECGFYPVGREPTEPLPPCDTCDGQPLLLAAKRRINDWIDARSYLHAPASVPVSVPTQASSSAPVVARPMSNPFSVLRHRHPANLAKETEYSGYKFRSRLEARYAVFFDELGVEWEYEPEAFDINGRGYLPDFHLPQVDVWVEVKGDPRYCDSQRYLEAGVVLDQRRRSSDGGPGLLIVGNIPHRISSHNVDSFPDIAWPGISFDSGTGQPRVDWWSFGMWRCKGRLWWNDFASPSDVIPKYQPMDNGVDPLEASRAYLAAKQARFEGGQTPKRN